MKEYNVIYTHLGNGLDVINKHKQPNNEPNESIAFIDSDRNVTFRDNQMPDEIKMKILKEAQTGQCTLGDIQLYTTNPIKKPYDKPDATITKEDMCTYGYTWAQMLPLNYTKALYLFKQGINPIYKLYDDCTESSIDHIDEFNRHNSYGGIFGIEQNNWNHYLDEQRLTKYNEYNELLKETMLLYNDCNMIGVYQKKDNYDKATTQRKDYTLTHISQLPKDTDCISMTVENIERHYSQQLKNGHIIDGDILLFKENGKINIYKNNCLCYNPVRNFIAEQKCEDMVKNATNQLKQCADKLTTMIQTETKYDDMNRSRYLANQTKLKKIIDEYGIRSVKLITAKTAQLCDYDARIQTENKKWMAQFKIQKEMYNTTPEILKLNVKPNQLNDFINQLRYNHY